MPAEFHFLRPDWLWALPLVILVTVLLAQRRLGAGSWQNVVSAALQPHVLSVAPNRKAEYRWWLLGLGGVLAVLALAGPAWQRIEQPVFRSDQALVIALDLSRSMDAAGHCAEPPAACAAEDSRHTRAAQERPDRVARVFGERVHGYAADQRYRHDRGAG